MSFKSLALVLVGVVIGVSIGPVMTRVAAQQRKPYVRLNSPRIPAVDPQNMTPEQKAVRGNANIAVLLNDPVRLTLGRSPVTATTWCSTYTDIRRAVHRAAGLMKGGRA